MKTRFIALFVVLTTLFVGCKNDKPADAMEAVAPKEDKNFKVTLNVTVKKDDTFSIFYTEDGTNDFTKIQPIWLEVKGSESPQDVVFNLPEDIVPSQLRLDFGINKEQQPIVINKFKMSYFGKSFEAPGEDFYIYFDADKSKTVYDKDKKTIDAVVKDGVRQSPSFYPNMKPLGDEITKIVK